MKTLKKIGRALLVAAFWLGVWALAVHQFGKPLLFPSPMAVIKTLGELLQTKEFYQATANSLVNIFGGMISAIAVACILAALTAKVRFIRELIHPVMAVIKPTGTATSIPFKLFWRQPFTVKNLPSGVLRTVGTGIFLRPAK